jgi:anti-sigma B factor antagonist
MEVSSESSDKMLVVSVTGRLDFGASAAFQQSLESAVAEARGRPLILDCSGLDYVSSAGLRSFLVGARAAKAANVRFLVCSLTKSVAEVFEISGFAKIIPALPDRAAAESAVSA